LPDVISLIRSKRIKCAGHVAHVGRRIGGRIILKWIVKEWVERAWTGFIWLRIGTSVTML
jgi:hypothetical protein